MTIQPGGRERQAHDKAVSDVKKIQKTASEHRWGGRTIFARVVREGKAMIHTSRRDRKAKAIAEVLAMIANAQAPLERDEADLNRLGIPESPGF